MKAPSQHPAPERPGFGLIQQILRALREDDLTGTAAQMTYYVLLGLFPSLIVAVALLDLLPLADARSSIELALDRFVAPVSQETAEMLRRYLTRFIERQPHGGLALWVLPALWASSRATRGARKALDHIFHSRPRSRWFVRRFKDLVLTVAAALLLGVADLLLVGGEQLAAATSTALDLPEQVRIGWLALRWPLTLGFLFGSLLLVYRYLPARRLPWRCLMAGALPAMAGWVLLGLGFRVWLQLLGRFDELYGSLASFFVLMTLIWCLSLTVLIGAVVAAAAAELSPARPPAP